MDINEFSQIEKAAGFGRSELFRLGMALLFIIGVMLYSSVSMGDIPGGVLLVAAAMIGGYMAVNIGANDVANNVGPAVGSRALTLTGAIIIAAIFEAGGALIAGGEVVGTIKNGIIDPSLIGDTDTFVWVMMVGAVGIALGLALYGPKLIRTVGSEITELDQSRAFCIAMAAAITVIIATQFGLPVSSTHIAVGAVFGVGFLREYLKASHSKRIDEIKSHHQGVERSQVEAYLQTFEQASVFDKGVMLRKLKEKSGAGELSKRERKQLKRIYRTELVKRAALLKIAAAWLITVPASGLLAAIFYFTIRGMMLEG